MAGSGPADRGFESPPGYHFSVIYVLMMLEIEFGEFFYVAYAFAFYFVAYSFLPVNVCIDLSAFLYFFNYIAHFPASEGVVKKPLHPNLKPSAVPTSKIY